MLKANFIPSFICMLESMLYEKLPEDVNEIKMFVSARHLIDTKVEEKLVEINS